MGFATHFELLRSDNQSLASSHICLESLPVLEKAQYVSILKLVFSAAAWFVFSFSLCGCTICLMIPQQGNSGGKGSFNPTRAIKA